MSEKNDKKLISLFYGLMIANVILYIIAAVLLNVFVDVSRYFKMLIIFGALLALFGICSLLDKLIINHFSHKWNVE